MSACNLQRLLLQKEQCLSKCLSKTCLKIYERNFSKIKNETIINDDKLIIESNENNARYNEINLQMLPKKLYEQIFGSECEKCPDDVILSIKKDLSKFGLGSEIIPESPALDIKIPSLQGRNIEEHFENIAREQVEPYKNVIVKMLSEKLPPIPKNFLLKDGWTRYTETDSPESVEFPLEDNLVFDVEICVKSGPLPVLACAASSSAWYTWVSKYLIQETQTSNFMKKPLTTDFLIPMESTSDDMGFNLTKFQTTPKIIVGHNVSYDRIRIKEQYWLNKTATRFLDTMSLHVSVSGTNSYQRAVLKSKNNEEKTDYLQSISSLNNLADVYKLYCKKKLDKSKRNVFVDGDLREIKEQFQELVFYCASDVLATHEVFKKIYPLFEKRFPHPATLAGTFELGLAYLPVNRNWKRYLEEAETIYEDLNLESKICLSKKADQVCRLLIDQEYKKDPWMWDEDWTIKGLKLKKGYEKVLKKELKNKSNEDKKKPVDLKEKFNYVSELSNYLPKRVSVMPGYPNWYRKLCQKVEKCVNTFPKVQNISTSMQVTPKILNLTWENYPLHFIKDQGWGFLVPHAKNNNTNLPLKQILILTKLNKESAPVSTASNDESRELKKLESNYSLNANLDDCCYFFKLPHKNGKEFNVGNPLAKDFVNKFSENVLVGADATATRVLSISKMCSYWKNNRDRILSQLVIWTNIKSSKNHAFDFGAIIPQVVASGTLTRRAVESTWMTASNANKERIGSELRGMINTPPGYSIVGADVDSQELWIASIIGDASLNSKIKIHGATPISWMTLIGNKTQGTDMHSMTAKAIGITRDQAKIINYARIYGAGKLFAERLLKQFDPTMSDKEAALKAKKMFSMTKGEKIYVLNERTIEENALVKSDWICSSEFKSRELARKLGKSRNDIFERRKWHGGSESAMFNSLEEIATQSSPTTPFLRSRLSRALEGDHDDKNLPTKINWVVQSSAVDFLHLILVCMRWLMKDKIRLCLTFHDEVRYLVPSKYKYNAATAMHVTNLLVRSFFVSRLQMKDLPMSVAFFTTVEVDTALRKDATSDCATPSNPHGLKEGYKIEYGESLNVWDALCKSKGCVGMLSSSSQQKSL